MISSQWSILFAIFLLLVINHQPYNGVTSAYTLQGKRALVTGSSAGIGKAIAKALAYNHCQVIIHYHVRQNEALQSCREINEISSRNEAPSAACAGVLQADFREATQIHQLIRQVDEIWPDGWDILINNAGVVTKLALEDDHDDTLTSWHETLQVNLHAPRLLSHLAVSRMRKRQVLQEYPANDGGVIINISSIHGEHSNEYMSAYAVSKAGLDALTRSMALEYAIHNIRANAVAPGVILVERTADGFAIPANKNAWTERLPTRRLGTTDEVAQTVLAMILNDWVTGSIWQVDGGMMARSNMPPRGRPLKEGGFC